MAKHKPEDANDVLREHGNDELRRRLDEAPEVKPKPRRNGKAKPPSNDVVTEDSAALEFARRHKGKLLYDHSTKKWHRWCASHWQAEETRLAFDWARNLARELARDEDPKARIVLEKGAFASGVERFAQADRAFAVTSDAWDQDQWLLGTPSGTVDLKTGRLKAADPADRISKITAVAPSAYINCPRYIRIAGKIVGAPK